jgi:hypothetical protein
MIYKIELDNFNVKIKTNNTNSLTKKLKTVFKRTTGIDLNNYICEKFGAEKCRCCKEEYPTVEIITIVENNSLIITGFKYIKKYIYCYGKNKKCVGKKLNPNSAEFIKMVMNLDTNDEALKYIKNNNKSPFYKENYTTEEEYKRAQSRDVNFYIEKYGEALGIETYNNIIKKAVYKRSLEYYIENHGYSQGKIIYDSIQKNKDNSSFNYFLKKHDNNEEIALFEFNLKNSKTIITIDNLIKKYGEEGTVRYQNFLDKCAYVHKIEYYIEKYGEEEGLILYEEINKIRTFNLENSIKKYGEEQGTVKYNNWKNVKRTSIEKFIELYGEEEGRIKRDIWLSNLVNRIYYCVSKESKKFFEILDNTLNIKGMFGDRKNEYKLKSPTNYYFYDYYNKDLNLIIEYNGVAYHPNPEKLSGDEWEKWRHPKDKTITADISYEKQKIKLEFAKQNGHNILEIWNDKSIDDNIKICENYINKIKII